VCRAFLLSIYPEKFRRIFFQEIIVAKRTNYQGEKRAKELNRLKKQSEKEERKKNNTNDQADETLPTENEIPPVGTD
jgi:hypothetical protein